MGIKSVLSSKNTEKHLKHRTALLFNKALAEQPNLYDLHGIRKIIIYYGYEPSSSSN